MTAKGAHRGGTSNTVMALNAELHCGWIIKGLKVPSLHLLML